MEGTNEQIVVILTRRIKYFTEYFILHGFIECMPGYTGLNCSSKCPYPTYGRHCQGLCNCREILCEVSFGCRTLTTGNIWPFYNNKADIVINDYTFMLNTD